jgi:hypothetical protein
VTLLGWRGKSTVRRRRGVSETAFGDAREASEESAPDVYLDALTRYVAALGGHLEVRAVFPEETITLLRQPEAQPNSTPCASGSSSE